MTSSLNAQTEIVLNIILSDSIGSNRCILGSINNIKIFYFASLSLTPKHSVFHLPQQAIFFNVKLQFLNKQILAGNGKYSSRIKLQCQPDISFVLRYFIALTRLK